MIKNYTSSVPVERTIMRIEIALIEGGAIGIQKEYETRSLKAISFSYPSTPERLVSIRLPSDVEAVYEILKKGSKRPRPGTLDALRAQAERTAWKLIQDWILVQMSLIEMRQVEFLQVFLPYVWDGKQTFFAALKAGGFKQLTQGAGSK
jgi:hypothetical protein